MMKFQNPNKKGGVRDTAFSVQPLALKVTFAIQNPLVFLQREARIIWEIEVLFQPNAKKLEH